MMNKAPNVKKNYFAEVCTINNDYKYLKFTSLSKQPNSQQR